MADTLTNWLALREPVDAAARSASLTQDIAEVLDDSRPVSILDLGAGTGSNVRHLASRLPAPQRWLLADRDPVLLADMPARMSSWAAAHGHEVAKHGDDLVIRGERVDCCIETRCLDLGALEDPGLFSGRHLVTASALLDLVSETWLRTLAWRCRNAGAAVLFALTYNGRSRCSPREPEDDAIRELMNRHQRASDKGFGPAAGPSAVGCVARSFAAVGYHVRREASDWTLSPDMRELQRQLIEGWAEAAIEISPAQAGIIGGWLDRRIAHVQDGYSLLTVCHEDVAAWMPSAGLR